MRSFLTWMAAILLPFSQAATAQDTHLQLSFELPRLLVSPYHRPYVAVWLETPQRKFVNTVVLWADDKRWHKDLRQWWRKQGRSNMPYDGVTAATRRPGAQKVQWRGKLNDGSSLPVGEYLLNLEVVREEGGRSYVRHKIHWQGEPMQFELANQAEVTNIKITLN